MRGRARTLHQLATVLLASLLVVPCHPPALAQEPRPSTDDVARAEVSGGIEHRRIVRTRPGSGGSTDRWVINVLEVDPRLARMDLALALDEIVGTEMTSSLVQRYGALAAINGGYFRTTGLVRGEPMGLLDRKGRLLSEPVADRAALSFGFDGTMPRTAFTYATAELQVRAANSVRQINGINRPRESNELILYTAEFHRTTLTKPGGCEVTIANNVVSSISRNGSQAVPANGYVLSGDGEAAIWLEQRLRKTRRIQLTTAVRHRPAVGFEIGFSIGGGPMLLSQGKAAGEAEFKTFSESLTTARHPRTAVGLKGDGHLVFVTVDGRQPGVSVGMTIAELRDLMLDLQCVEAINLDGGGSTTMVIRDKVVNQPSDATGERPVSDALLIFARP